MQRKKLRPAAEGKRKTLFAINSRIVSNPSLTGLGKACPSPAQNSEAGDTFSPVMLAECVADLSLADHGLGEHRVKRVYGDLLRARSREWGSVFAKLASFAKNTDMGWSPINFISALQEDSTRCRISR